MKETIRLPNILNLSFVEGLYADYLRDPSSVGPEWHQYFEGMENGERSVARPALGPAFPPRSVFNPPPVVPGAARQGALERTVAGMQDRVDQLIRAYRFGGHAIARINPL